MTAEDCGLSHVIHWGISPMSHVFVEWSTVTCLYILPTVFQVLINGRVTCPNHVWSCDMLDDQFLGWSRAIFPGSRAVKSCDPLGTRRSCDESHDGLCDRFPRSRVLEITWLELSLGAVIEWLVIVKWVLGSFGNAFLVGVSFTRDIEDKLKESKEGRNSWSSNKDFRKQWIAN